MNKHTPAPWIVREVAHSNVPGQRAFAIDFNEDQEQVVDWVYEEADAKLIAAAPDILKALQWALPLARIAMEDHRMKRVMAGHKDIFGTYKNGESWVGIYQSEIDEIEFAVAALSKATQ